MTDLSRRGFLGIIGGVAVALADPGFAFGTPNAALDQSVLFVSEWHLNPIMLVWHKRIAFADGWSRIVTWNLDHQRLPSQEIEAQLLSAHIYDHADFMKDPERVEAERNRQIAESRAREEASLDPIDIP